MRFAPNEKQFEVLYHGLIIGGHLVQQKGLTVLKREIEILDQLEAISKECECGKLVDGTKEPSREYTSGVITLTPEQFKLLFEYISSVPWSTGKASRLAVSTLEALNDAGQDSNRKGNSVVAKEPASIIQ